MDAQLLVSSKGTNSSVNWTRQPIAPPPPPSTKHMTNAINKASPNTRKTPNYTQSVQSQNLQRIQPNNSLVTHQTLQGMQVINIKQ